MVPYARLGGQTGLRMSRAAFAVMVKFSDLLEDFVALVDFVSMEAGMAEDGPSKDKELIAAIKKQPQADLIIRRWESAARMRQWINEKKQAQSEKLEKVVAAEVRAKKAEERKKEREEKQRQQEAEEAKKAEAEEAKAGDEAEKGEGKEAPAEAPAEEKIDSSSKPVQEKGEKSEKKDAKKDEKSKEEKDEKPADEPEEAPEEAPELTEAEK